MFQILVVEDDRELNRTVCSFLNQRGYEATGCLNASDAYDAMYSSTFDLIISDIMMPGIDGFEFVKTVRTLNEDIPVLFMTAQDDFASKQKGYRVGIDDYMVKPIDLDELLLRIGALLSRSKIASSRRLEVGAFVMDADEHTAYWKDEEIPMTMREFSILYKLLSYPKKTFTRSQLMDEFWDADTASGSRTVDVLGIGMCCAMVWQGIWFIPGIIVGLAGIGIIAAAYPVFNHVTKKEREKIAPEIIRLTDELLK